MLGTKFVVAFFFLKGSRSKRRKICAASYSSCMNQSLSVALEASDDLLRLLPFSFFRCFKMNLMNFLFIRFVRFPTFTHYASQRCPTCPVTEKSRFFFRIAAPRMSNRTWEVSTPVFFFEIFGALQRSTVRDIFVHTPFMTNLGDLQIESPDIH